MNTDAAYHRLTTSYEYAVRLMQDIDRLLTDYDEHINSLASLLEIGA